MAASRTASRRVTATSRCPTCPASASKARAISRARWRRLRPDPRRSSSIEPAIEAKRHRQQVLPIIEAVRERVIEPCIEHELATAARTAFHLETIQQPRTMATTALTLVGHQIIDIKKTAVHQILLHPEARECNRALRAPNHHDRIALLRLPPPALDELCFGAELRAQRTHQRIARRNISLTDHANVRLR